jgi:chromosomal replication initiator protein
MQEFRKTYRDIDALIVDDVQQLARKNATQEEFFHTFNPLQTLGRQIILSADCSPSHLQEIEPRLISRFEWGIAIELSAPDANKKIRILEQKARQLELELPQEIFPFLAEKFPSSPKAPIEAIHSLALRTTKVRDLHHAEQLLADLLKKESAEALTTEKIIRQIGIYFGIRAEDLTGKSQMREFAQPRQIAMYFCRKLLQIPFQGIGRLFGRDHSTVMSSIKQVEKGIENREAPYAESIEAISRKFLIRLKM